jgi:multidrug resistance efflux pump
MTSEQPTGRGMRSKRMMIWYVVAAVVVAAIVLTIVLVASRGNETEDGQVRDRITTAPQTVSE